MRKIMNKVLGLVIILGIGILLQGNVRIYAADTYQFGTDESNFTERTIIYRSGTVYDDMHYPATTTVYECTQGIDREGNVVPISRECLVPYSNSKDATIKYDFYKKTPEGYTDVGTNDPAEAYTINERIEAGKEGSYLDIDKKSRYIALQPKVTVNITLRIDWDKTNYFLSLINADRAEQGVAPLVLDKNVTELAIQRTAEEWIIPHHQTPDGKRYDGLKWNECKGDSKLKISGENAQGGSFYKAENVEKSPDSYKQYINEDFFEDITDAMMIESNWAYRTSPGHYQQYMKETHIAAGLSVASNGFHDTYTVEEFASGNQEDIVPLIKTGIEYRTVPVTIIDTEFDYKLVASLHTLDIGTTQKLAYFAQPIDYWWINTFNNYLSENFYQYSAINFYPFDFSSLTFTSSDPTVATVDEKGYVTGIKEGTVTITSSLQGKHTKETTVVVQKAAEPTSTPTPTVTPAPTKKPTNTNPLLKPQSERTVQSPKVKTGRTIKATKFKKGDKIQKKKKGKWVTVYTFKKTMKEREITPTGTYRVIRKSKKKTTRIKTTYQTYTQIIPCINGVYAKTSQRRQCFRGTYQKGSIVKLKGVYNWLTMYTLQKASDVVYIYGTNSYRVEK